MAEACPRRCLGSRATSIGPNFRREKAGLWLRRSRHSRRSDLGGVFAPDEERAALQTVFPTIFEDQLKGWWRDRVTWPTPRSFGTFTSWFDCQFHSTLLDLADEPPLEEYI